MYRLILLPVCWLLVSCQGPVSAKKVTAGVFPPAATVDFDDRELPANAPALPEPPPYSNLVYEKKEQISAAAGTKSVLFNRRGDRLYAMNLEGMSISEFDRPGRKLLRQLSFKPTSGTGWDYETDKPIPSYQEKPVEACLSHEDKILWVSLHNAEGIVPIRLDSLQANKAPWEEESSRRIYVSYPGQTGSDSFAVPLVKTGKTPKVIAKTVDDHYLLVSNWHSYTVSALKIDTAAGVMARVVDTIRVTAIPRGIAVDDGKNKSYVAIMGGARIEVINNATWQKEAPIPVSSNPRHILLDSSGRLFVSFNKLAKIACIDASTGKTLFSATTHAQPRTIILSKNQKFLFVTCYSSDFLDVYKINDRGFEKIASLPCKGHPVGVDIFEDDFKLEAWVCSYTFGSISVFSFRKE